MKCVVFFSVVADVVTHPLCSAIMVMNMEWIIKLPFILLFIFLKKCSGVFSPVFVGLPTAGGDICTGIGIGKAWIPQRGKRTHQKSKSTDPEFNGVLLWLHHFWLVTFLIIISRPTPLPPLIHDPVCVQFLCSHVRSGGDRGEEVWRWLVEAEHGEAVITQLRWINCWSRRPYAFQVK